MGCHEGQRIALKFGLLIGLVSAGLGDEVYVTSSRSVVVDSYIYSETASFMRCDGVVYM